MTDRPLQSCRVQSAPRSRTRRRADPAGPPARGPAAGRTSPAAAALSLLLGVVSGCGILGGESGEGGVGSSDAPTYAADIRPVIEGNCARCHVEGGIAPMPLTTYADAHAFRASIAAEVEAGRMPPWLPATGCNDYQDDLSLAPAQRQALLDWVDAGAPAGEAGVNDGAAGSDADGGGEREVGSGYGTYGEAGGSTDRPLRRDLSMAMPAPYSPVKVPDEYRCFLFEWPATGPTYATGYEIVPGNQELVHHVIAYLLPPGAVTSVRELDAADDAPGYECFGGPGGEAGAGGGIPKWLGGWAPGGSGANHYAPNTGIEIEPGSAVALQVHYNALAPTDATDRTRIDVEVTSTVEREGNTLPFLNPLWPGVPGTMAIPAGATDATHSYTADPTEDAIFGPLVFGGDDPQPILIHRVALHMHRLGSRGSLHIERADGSRECLLKIDEWDFDWQDSFRFVEPVRLDPGDKLTIECEWNNGPANQPRIDGERREPVEVTWGEGTADEMCLGPMFVSEL